VDGALMARANAWQLRRYALDYTQKYQDYADKCTREAHAAYKRARFWLSHAKMVKDGPSNSK
jgi:hypothetical protein